ncbi:ABC transporter permease [Clostridium sp. AM58-1XD]|uniref:ABC transporter permease n=1 Tax=Clostridium sp. AM58-1XD TaxID=2292307 RepID=UPI000E48DA8C|nr:ABC transporter permease [Clostridium sp. AM58-1XD]RGZ00634.1 ABC transporter permease [Clostridium sp. AM58-1XD]
MMKGKTEGKGRFRRKLNRKTAAGLWILAAVLCLAAAGPAVSGYTFDDQRIEEQNLAPRIPGLERLGIFDGTETVVTSEGRKQRNRYEENGLGDTYYWFGSDVLGRDIFTRTWMGTGISLLIALLAVAADMAAGVVYGMVSGYFGGRVDFIMQRLTEIISGIPSLVIATLLILVLRPGFLAIALSIAVTGWIGMNRVARAKVLELKEREYIIAARTQGAGHLRLLFREILPNMTGPILVTTFLSVPNAIFTEAFLAFIGLGIPAPYASLGTLISEGFQVFTIHPYMIVPPAFVLIAVMMGFNLTADGLRDMADRKNREG